MRRLLLVPVIALLAVFFTALPASAAAVTTLTVDGDDSETVTVAVGSEVEVAWSVTFASSTGLEGPALSSDPTVAGFDDPEAPNPGSTIVTFPEAGSFTLTVSAADDGGADARSVTVNVVEQVEIPVPDVTFPDPCTVVLPEVDNVSYGFNTGQSGGEIAERGEIDLAPFYNFGETTTFVALPAEGFTFPEGEDGTFDVVVPDDCLPTIVEAAPVCKGVTFTNVTDDPVFVLYGSPEGIEADDELEIPAGGSVTVDTTREVVLFVAGRAVAVDEAIQVGIVEVEQDCLVPADREAAFPTVAPAAGESGSGAKLAALSTLGAALLAGAGIAVRRRTA